MQNKIVMQGLTFDDVLLIPAYSEVTPAEVNIGTQLTKDIHLNIPLMTAAMDTVTESSMAIAMAREGGIGIIHKNMPVARQAQEVDRVKRSENGVITNPFSLSPKHLLADAENLMRTYRISGVPITEDGKLVGILTNRDLKFEEDLRRPIYEVMTSKNLITGPQNISMEDAKELLRKHKVEKLPLVDENNNLKGLVTIKDIEKSIKYPNSARDASGRLLVGAAVGATANLLDHAAALNDVHVDVLVLDSAHGHSKNILRSIELLKKNFPGLPVIAGNVATSEGARALIDCGADAVKVGMGPGSICTTRVVAGIGVPQLTAVMSAVEVDEWKGIPVIADGGIKYSGEITKALAAGANVIMIGSLFAGCEESPSDMELFQGRRYKVYRGMGSEAAMKIGGRDRYFQENAKKFVPEGIEGRVPYKGPLADVVFQLMGGLRSGMGYCGAKDIATLHETARFMQITSSSLRESHPHDVYITKEAPNYGAAYNAE